MPSLMPKAAFSPISREAFSVECTTVPQNTWSLLYACSLDIVTSLPSKVNECRLGAQEYELDCKAARIES